jgi:D-glucosaminate-specific PTS system IIC component
MVFGLALLAGLWWWIGQSKIGYTLHAVICQPIVMALPFGLIAGDVVTAMKIGASVEMVYLGMVAAGANIPADECLAGCIAIPIALTTGMEPATAVTLAVPFGLLGVFQDQIRRTLQAAFAHKADAYAVQGNVKGIERCAMVYPMILGFILRFPIVFAAIYLGSDVVQKVLNVIPEWLTHGLSVTGSTLPALGFAITIFIIGKNIYLPFFILGFFAVQYLQINVMAAAIFGTCMALLITFLRRESTQN